MQLAALDQCPRRMRHLLQLEPGEPRRCGERTLLGEQWLGLLRLTEMNVTLCLYGVGEKPLGRSIRRQEVEGLLREDDLLTTVEAKARFPKQERSQTCLIIRIRPGLFRDMKWLRGFLPFPDPVERP